VSKSVNGDTCPRPTTQEQLGLQCALELQHHDPDFGTIVTLLDLEDLAEDAAVLVVPTKGSSSSPRATGGGFSKRGAARSLGKDARPAPANGPPVSLERFGAA
jgi:hypothetical protein